MRYNTIVNPATNRKVSIHSNLGYKILKNYVIQSGGASVTMTKANTENNTLILTLKQSISQREAMNKIIAILKQLDPNTSERELKLQAFELVDTATDDRGRVLVSFIEKWEQEHLNSKSDSGRGLKRFIGAIQKVAIDNRAKNLVRKIKDNAALQIQGKMRVKLSQKRLNELKKSAAEIHHQSVVKTEMHDKLHRAFVKVKALKNILDIKDEIAQKKLKAQQNWKKIKNLTKATSAFSKSIIKDDLGVKPVDYGDRYKAELEDREQRRLDEDDEDDEDLQVSYNYFTATLDKAGSLTSSTLKSVGDWKLSRYEKSKKFTEKQLKSRFRKCKSNTPVDEVKLLLSDLEAFTDGYRNKVGLWVSGWSDTFTDSELENERNSGYTKLHELIKRGEIQNQKNEELALKKLYRRAKTYNEYQRFIQACHEHLDGNNNRLWGKKVGYGKFEDESLNDDMINADKKALEARIQEEKEEQDKRNKAEKQEQERRDKEAEKARIIADKKEADQQEYDKKMEKKLVTAFYSLPSEDSDIISKNRRSTYLKIIKSTLNDARKYRDGNWLGSNKHLDGLAYESGDLNDIILTLEYWEKLIRDTDKQEREEKQRIINEARLERERQLVATQTTVVPYSDGDYDDSNQSPDKSNDIYYEQDDSDPQDSIGQPWYYSDGDCNKWNSKKAYQGLDPGWTGLGRTPGMLYHCYNTKGCNIAAGKKGRCGKGDARAARKKAFRESNFQGITRN